MARSSRTVIVARLPLLVAAMACLATGVMAGLARLAVEVPAAAATHAGMHGALMVAAFFGTVISLERAVALGGRWPYLAPLAAACGGVCLLLGVPTSAGQWLFVIAAAALAAGNVVVVGRQAALFTVTLLIGALCWLIGNLAWAVAGTLAAALPWWIAFLVLTIAGERLDLTRFLRTPAAARNAFMAIVALVLVGAAFATGTEGGLAPFAGALLLLAGWLLRFDIVSRTIRQEGLTRYIAVCLTAGYLWLAVAGCIGLAGGLVPGNPWRDAALHAVMLGFVFSMVFGHAPIIVPAVARVRVAWGTAFYLPLAVLHGSIALRVAGDLLGDFALRRAGGMGNGLALALFVATLFGAIWRAAGRPAVAAMKGG